MEPPPIAPDVLAAGGLVRRRVGGHTRLAVVHRNRHGGDWTLPKGHVEPSEPLAAAAVREVREETGWDAQPTSLHTAITYDTGEGPKYVLLWNMDAIAERSAPARDEVLGCAWLSYRRARRRLTYSQERKVVADLERAEGSRLRSFTTRQPQRERLAEGISLTRSRLRALHGVVDATSPAWLLEADEALDDADDALRDGELDRGWALVLLAGELEVVSYDDVTVTVKAATVRAELSSGKFSAWRRAAIQTLIDPVLLVDAKRRPVLSPAERQARLAEALQNRNEAYSNEYRNVAITRRFQAILLTIAIAILVGSLVGAALTNPRFEQGADEWWAAVGAALSGALGGITSALQRTTRRSIERIPERLGSLGSSLSRPAIGAIAGVTVFLAVRAGVTQTATEQQVAYLLLLAFGAGFTERLVVRDPREDLADRSARVDPDPATTLAAAAALQARSSDANQVPPEQASSERPNEGGAAGASEGT